MEPISAVGQTSTPFPAWRPIYLDIHGSEEDDIVSQMTCAPWNIVTALLRSSRIRQLDNITHIAAHDADDPSRRRLIR